jgi:cytochrome P450
MGQELAEKRDWEQIDGIDVRAALRRSQQAGALDIYTVYEDLRSKVGSVYEGDILVECFGSPRSAAAMVSRPVVSVLGIHEALAVYKDPKVFSSTIMQESVGASMGRNLLVVDPPEHTRLRSAVQAAFGKRSMESLGKGFADAAVAEALAAIQAEGETDFFVNVLQWLPATVVFGMLGLPLAQKEQFRLYSTALTLMSSDVPQVAMACSQWLAEALNEFMRNHSARVERDEATGLIDMILAAQEPLEDGLTGQEMLDFLRVLLPAGSDTTIAGLSTLFLALLTHPEQLEMVRNDPSLIGAAIDEALRWQAPNQFTYRLTMSDTHIGDTPVARGTGVIICEGAANRDPSRWDNPHQFDITRKPQLHVAFGGGAHSCLGAHLARVEMQSAVEGTLSRLPGFRLDDTKPAPKSVGLMFRSVDSLPVRWD